MPEERLLVADGIAKHFGGIHALDDARFELMPGEIHALMGENGAGKSTLGKILAGVLQPDCGTMLLEGCPFEPSNPLAAQAAGIAMIFQELDLFPALSIAENIAIGNRACSTGGWVRHGKLDEFCRPFLEQVGLQKPAGCAVGDLSIGHQQLVAVARALSMNARILVMDESTSALTEDAAENLFVLMRALRDRGVSIIYVSHKLDEIFHVCDRVTVLRDGRFVGTRMVADTSREELVSLMVGRGLDQKLRNRSHAGAQPLLELQQIGTRSLSNASFTLHRGEVLGFAGLVGAGRSGIGRALFGVDRVTTGACLLHGEPYEPRSPRNAMCRSVGFVPEDRKGMGLMMQMGVRENMTITTLFRAQRFGVIRGNHERTRFGTFAEKTRLKAAPPGLPVATLSGGNQQKVLLARWLMLDPEILFLDDPTRGVDVGAKEDIYGLIEALAAAGKGVMMVSSELPELLRCCDRIVVMNAGRMAATLRADETTQEEIMHFAAGGSQPLGANP